MSLDHNIDSLIGDIEDRKDDLHDNMKRRVGAAMRGVLYDARTYIADQSNVEGDLLRSLGMNTDDSYATIAFDVHAGGPSAPYADVVEYGAGPRSNIWYEQAGRQLPISDPPSDYPFQAPDIDNPSGFAYYIEQWMRKKGISPDYGSYRASALAITKTMEDQGMYAHPFMRPAWIDNENKVRRAARNAIRGATR